MTTRTRICYVLFCYSASILVGSNANKRRGLDLTPPAFIEKKTVVTGVYTRPAFNRGPALN